MLVRTDLQLDSSSRGSIMAKKTKRKIAYRTLPMQRQLNLPHEGKHFDLGEMFNQLNKRYFRGRLRNYKVEWGRRRRHRPKDHFVFGTIQEEDRIIRIHPLLDQAFVPTWYLKYVLYHEMLHSVVPDKLLRSGRPRAGLRRRGSRCYVLLDEKPESCRE